jgi:hypothetical protein
MGMAVGISLVVLTAGGCSAGSGPATGPDGKENTGATSSALSPSDPVAEVAVDFFTGGDDKRSDSVVTFQLTINGVTNTYQTDGQGTDWGNNTWSGFFYATLPQNTVNGDISNLVVNLAEHDSFIESDDNWNLQEISVWTENPNGSWSNIGTPGGNPLKRFTGSSGQWSWGTWPQ